MKKVKINNNLDFEYNNVTHKYSQIQIYRRSMLIYNYVKVSKYIDPLINNFYNYKLVFSTTTA